MENLKNQENKDRIPLIFTVKEIEILKSILIDKVNDLEWLNRPLFLSEKMQKEFINKTIEEIELIKSILINTETDIK